MRDVVQRSRIENGVLLHQIKKSKFIYHSTCI